MGGDDELNGREASAEEEADTTLPARVQVGVDLVDQDDPGSDDLCRRGIEDMLGAVVGGKLADQLEDQAEDRAESIAQLFDGDIGPVAIVSASVVSAGSLAWILRSVA